MALGQVDFLSNNLTFNPVLSILNENEINTQTNNISELLSGNTLQDKLPENHIAKQPMPENNSDKSACNTIKHFLTGCLIGVFAIPLEIKFGPKILNLLHKFNPIRKFSTAHFLKKELKFRKLKLSNFKPINFSECNNLKEIKRLAKKLGIKVVAKNEDVSTLNELFKVLTDINNQSKGRILLPKKLVLVDKLKDAGGTANRYSVIEIAKDQTDKIDTLLHEMGHINHFNKLRFYRDVQLMGKKFKDFGINDDMLDKISHVLGNYATTDPYEFVAVTYDALLSGRKLPKFIMDLYHKFKGPANWKLIKEPIIHYPFNQSLNKFANEIREGLKNNSITIIDITEFLEAVK